MGSNKSMRLLEIIAIALLYVVAARIGQIFSIPPGNITPIWIPSGLMLALVILRGYGIWPGIFLGAFLGNIWAYFEPSSAGATVAALLAATANGLGDVLSAVGAVYLLERYAGSINPFAELRVFWRFLFFGAFLGPLVSAVFGVTSLSAVGVMPWDSYAIAFLTWWMGDGVGALLIAPAILVFKFRPDERMGAANGVEFWAYVAAALAISALTFLPGETDLLLPETAFLKIPLLIWGVIRLGLKTTFVTVLLFAVVGVVGASQGLGPFVRDSQWSSLITMHSYFALVATTVFVVGSIVTDKQRLLSEMAAMAEHDALTAVYNRHYFDRALDTEIVRHDRLGNPFSLIMIDVDHFKQINDRHGHGTGDFVLKQIAGLLQEHLRDTDILARWGGEEFMLLLPGATIEGAFGFAERCRHRVEASETLRTHEVTISLGVIEYAAGMDRSRLLSELDAALYRSKQTGRNSTSRALPEASQAGTVSAKPAGLTAG